MLTSRGLGRVLGDLASMGFDARWGVLGAANVGAPHQRDRIWIVGKATNSSINGLPRQADKQVMESQRGSELQLGEPRNSSQMADTRCELRSTGNSTNLDSKEEIGSTSAIHNQSSCEGQNVSNSSSIGQQRQGKHEQSFYSKAGSKRQTNYVESIGSPDFWKTEPNVGRVADGVAASMDRLKSIGNGQVPLCAATAWRILNDL